MRIRDPRDLVLAVVAFNKGQKVKGRTVLQKLAYFLNEKLTLGLEFRPHYYGPYSESVAMAISSLVAIDFLTEKEEALPGASTDMFEARKYTYELTQAGKEVVEKLQQLEPEVLGKIKAAMEEITTKEECSYECLSLAAKMFHILKSQGKRVTESQLSDIAKDLGWQLGKQEIETAAKFLKGLGLIMEAS